MKKIFLTASVLLVILILLPALIYAAPSVTGVSGTISNGQSVTISGTGFGANGPNVVFFDDYEQGTNGASLTVGAGSAVIGTYDHFGSPSPIYSTDYHFSGAKAFKNDISSTFSQAAIPLPTGVTEVFASYNCYVPTGQNFPGEGTTDGINWKMLWLLGVDGDNGTAESPTIFLAANALDNIHTGANNPDASVVYPAIWSGSTFNKGEWNFYSLWYKLGTNSNGGAYITYKNSLTQGTAGSNTANYTASATTNDIRYVYLNGYDRITPGTSVYFDDVYVATGPYSRARIEIGNSSSYATSTKLAIATATSWSDGSIQATIRQGSFNSEDPAYLYVIDANGNVSLSYGPITFSGSSTVNGVCGSSNGLTLTTAPITGLCSAGSASSVTGSGPWSWTCAGSSGCGTASCSAYASGGGGGICQ